MAAEHARAFIDQPDVALVAVAGEFEDQTRAFAEKFRIPVFGTSMEKVLAAGDPDIVVAAVSLPAIRDVYPRLISLPYLLLLEKPFGVDLGDACAFNDLAAKRAYPIYIAMNRRQYANVRILRSQLNGCHGTRFIQVVDQETLDFPRSRGFEPSLIANWPFANAIHLIDLIRFLGRGRVVSVTSEGWNNQLSEPTILTARIEFDSGDVAAYQALWSVPGPWSVCVATADKYWEMKPLEELRWRTADSREWQVWQPEREHLAYKAGLWNQANQVVRAYRGEVHSLVDVPQALESVQLLASIYGGASAQ